MKHIKILLMAVITILSVSVFAQENKNKTTNDSKQSAEKTKYSCPMHPEVTGDKPGNCSKCGMAMNLSPKEKMKYEVVKLYTCPMHPDMSSGKSGKCPKCGMEMKAVEKKGQTYSCSMHPEVTSDKPGKCSKCGMAMNLSPKEKMKHEVMKLYTCPMHADVTSNKPGKCSKCGMALTEKKEDHSGHKN